MKYILVALLVVGCDSVSALRQCYVTPGGVAACSWVANYTSLKECEVFKTFFEANTKDHVIYFYCEGNP